MTHGIPTDTECELYVIYETADSRRLHTFWETREVFRTPPADGDVPSARESDGGSQARG